MYGDDVGGIRSDVDRIGDSATSVELLPLNNQRKEAIIVNDSSATLYIKFGTTASTTDFTLKVLADETITTRYRGKIDGIWASDAGGAAQVTELT
jgi:hypothetical protein